MQLMRGTMQLLLRGTMKLLRGTMKLLLRDTIKRLYFVVPEALFDKYAYVSGSGTDVTQWVPKMPWV